MFYALATNEQYLKSRLNLFVALAPVVSMNNSSMVGFWKILLGKCHQLEKLLQRIGIFELFGKSWERIFETILRFIPDLRGLRKLQKFFNPKYDDAGRAKIFEGHFPHGTNFRSIIHYAQLHLAQKFRYFDYGIEENQKRYGNDEPPEIDVT